MRRIRVSIAGLLAAIAVLAVTIAALIHPSRLWASTFYSLTIATLTIATLGAIYGRGPTRAFRVGFATCGWAYFLAIWGPEPLSSVGEELVTPGILDNLYPFTIPRAEGQDPTKGIQPVTPQGAARVRANLRGGGSTMMVGAFGGGGPAAPPPTAWGVWTEPVRVTNMFGQPQSPTFRTIGQSIFCLMVALIGGILTRRFQRERERSPAGVGPVAPG